MRAGLALREIRRLLMREAVQIWQEGDCRKARSAERSAVGVQRRRSCAKSRAVPASLRPSGDRTDVTNSVRDGAAWTKQARKLAELSAVFELV